jgi:hypothetical protein
VCETNGVSINAACGAAAPQWTIASSEEGGRARDYPVARPESNLPHSGTDPRETRVRHT